MAFPYTKLPKVPKNKMFWKFCIIHNTAKNEKSVTKNTKKQI